MVRRDCRLCFQQKPYTIGIFSSEGINLQIASVIHMHFPADEVRIDDNFPKFVCPECWLKVADFHDFYNAVDEAKKYFVEIVAKKEIPNVDDDNAVNYSVQCEDDDSLKSEPMDFDFVQVEMPTIEQVNIPTNVTAQRIESSAIEVKVKEKVPILAYAPKPITPGNGSGAQLISEFMNMTCFYCGIQINTVYEITEHHQNEHSEEYHLRVKCCDIKLELTELVEHMEYHRQSDKYKCKICHKKFLLPKFLKKHYHRHKPNAFQCDICKEKFHLLTWLKQHIIATHTTNEVAQDSSIAIRGKGIANIKAPKFSASAKTAPQTLKLATHANTNDKIVSSLQCTICNRSLSTKRKLESHIRVKHEQSIQLACHICGETFDTNQHLLEHLQTHDVVEPKVYSEAPTCHICGIKFHIHTNIREHLKKHETMTPRIACKICGRMYKNEQTLRRHSIIHDHDDNGINISCSQCVRTFKNRRELAEHERSMHELSLPGTSSSLKK